MSELVTGDAVVLGLRPARLPSRALAVFIDLLLVWTAYVLVAFGLLMATASLDAAAVAAVEVALFLLVPVGVPIAVETLSNGRSVGKLVCGLRVVREDGGPIRFRHALVRGAIGVVEIQLFVGVIACVASLVSARGRRIGDVFAGTLVVRERVPAARTGRMPPAPPWLAGQFGGVDLSRVPDGLWLAVRQYLIRAGQLDEAVGRSMAERLAGDVAGYTGAPVPQGVPPWAYLAAVVAERQARDARRAFGGSRPATAERSAPPPAQAPAATGWGPSRVQGREDGRGQGRGQEQARAQTAAAGGFVPPGGPADVVPARQQAAPSAPGPGAGSGAEGEQRGTGFVPPA